MDRLLCQLSKNISAAGKVSTTSHLPVGETTKATSYQAASWLLFLPVVLTGSCNLSPAPSLIQAMRRNPTSSAMAGRATLSGGGFIIEFAIVASVCLQELAPPGGELTAPAAGDICHKTALRARTHSLAVRPSAPVLPSSRDPGC